MSAIFRRLFRSRLTSTLVLASLAVGIGALVSCTGTPAGIRRMRGDEATAREAIQGYAGRGEEALPELRDSMDDPDPLVRRRVKTAKGRITGQWGSDGSGLRWKRSVAEATGQDRPIMVLHLFGKLDEEFC